MFLCVEQPEVWRVTLNGQPLPSLPDGWWVDTAFQKILIPGRLLNLGRNELLLETEFRMEINIEAVYLLGKFGVCLGGTCPVLTRLPERVVIGDLTTQGLPFYGGSITYHLPVPEAAKSALRLCVMVPSFEAACLRVQADAEAHIIAWPPYRAVLGRPQGSTIALEAVLTRRNTFGPLHQRPLRAGAYGPGNFVTQGDGFSDAYMLYPAGSLLPPVLSWQNS